MRRAFSTHVAPVHDPAAIKEGTTYYMFCSGGRADQGVIPIRTSSNLRTWKASGYVFDALPAWAAGEIPQARNAWAPDVSRFNGKFHLYYSVSSFGSRNSAIGLATTRTLDPANPDYKWVDQGLVLRSYQDKDDWNAIDPNVVIEDEKNVWLTWGSFWGGIKMRRIDPATGKLSSTDTTLYSLSSRPRETPINGSVEAPFIFRHGDYWYLFVSFDRCCRGAESTYNVVVGRSRDVTGPYVDKTGTAMTEGGGSLVSRRRPDVAWSGPSRCSCARRARTICSFTPTSAKDAAVDPRCRFRRWCGRTAGRASACCRNGAAPLIAARAVSSRPAVDRSASACSNTLYRKVYVTANTRIGT